MNALLGLGVYQSLDDLSALPRASTVFTPAMNPGTARLLYEGWLAAVRKVLQR